MNDWNMLLSQLYDHMYRVWVRARVTWSMPRSTASCQDHRDLSLVIDVTPWQARQCCVQMPTVTCWLHHLTRMGRYTPMVTVTAPVIVTPMMSVTIHCLFTTIYTVSTTASCLLLYPMVTALYTRPPTTRRSVVLRLPMATVVMIHAALYALTCAVTVSMPLVIVTWPTGRLVLVLLVVEIIILWVTDWVVIIYSSFLLIICVG